MLVALGKSVLPVAFLRWAQYLISDDDLALFDSNKISINANRDYLTLPIGKYEFIYGSHLDTDSTNISISFEFMMVPSNVQPDITGAGGDIYS